jgi:FkbH-like protein
MNDAATLDLHWLPAHPSLKASVKAVQAMLGGNPTQLLGALRSVANHRLDFLGTMQVDRLAKAVFEAAPCIWPELRLAVLGSASTDHLHPAIRVAGVRRGLQIDLFAAGFGLFRQELLQPDSALRLYAPDAVLIALRPGDIVDRLPLGADVSEVEIAIAAAVASLVELWRVARSQIGATVIQQTFLDTDYPIFGNFDGAVPASPLAIVEGLNRAIRAAAVTEGVLILDVARWSAIHGLGAWYDPGRWHHAKQLIAPTAAAFYGDLVGRLLGAVRGLSAKCLVLDLDNTVWGGVIGDDGLDGIVLGQGSGLGEAYVAFQTYVKQLAERGVILAVCSKNTHQIAEAAFLQHPEMVLKRDDIAAFVANWNDKPSNLRDIARILNIGIESLVFFDDNPVERDIVRQLLPGVAVPEAPDDASLYVSCLAEAGYFEAIAFTEEDRARGEQYRANSRRNAALGSGADIGAYLASLEMRMQVSPFTAINLARITQLTNKSNQFNLTTKRYTQDQIAAFAASQQALTMSCRLIDKFGDNGLIAVLIAVPDAADPGALRIDTWLMSCRVLGRQVETETLNQLCADAKSRGFTTVVGAYLPTSKNGVVRDLYARLGFRQIADHPDGSTEWALPLAEFQPTPTAIAVTPGPDHQLTE